MALFLAYLPDRIARARLQEAVKLEARIERITHEVRYAASWEEMHALAHQSAPQLAVFDPYASREMDTDSCASFGARFVSVALFAYGDFGRDVAQDVLRLAQLGVRGVATWNHDDEPTALGLRLSEALSYGIVGEVLAALQDRLTPELVRVTRYVLSNVHRHLAPAEVAKKAGVCCEKTLREHLKDAGLPPINKLIVWMRLLHAAHLLQDPARSVENVALRLNFPSANSLRNQLKQYAGVCPRELQVRDGFQFLLGEFCERNRSRPGSAGVGNAAAQRA